MFDIRYRGLRLIPSKTAGRELIKYGFMIEDCKEILENGYSPRKRKRGTEEKWIDSGDKTYNVVVVKSFNFMYNGLFDYSFWRIHKEKIKGEKMRGMKCVCGKIAQYKKHMKFNGYDTDGWECRNCGEVYYNPEKAEKILLINKLKKHKFNLKLSKVKSNLILRIPKEVSEALNLRKGEFIEFGLRGNDEIVIHPLEASLKTKFC